MLTIALNAARSAGTIIARASGRLDKLKITEKGDNDLVTDIDQAAEREIVYQLRRAYPDHAFLGEENGLQGDADSDYRWIIDPLDGTVNFTRGIPHFAVSIACEYRGRLQHAVVLDPMRDEAFTASRGRGAQVNGQRLRVTKRPGLAGATVATAIPSKHRNAEYITNYMQNLEAVVRQGVGIRRFGVASLDLAYVAAGRFDAFWEIGLQPWDIAAGILLIQEAGGLVSDFHGGDGYMESGNIVAGSPKCFKGLLQVVEAHLS